LVLIAGTGSYCALLKPIEFDSRAIERQIELISAGGWGHLLGDQGSGKNVYPETVITNKQRMNVVSI
jgi:N-acetylglucosamine kinase-like BadF-type ATPase